MVKHYSLWLADLEYLHTQGVMVKHYSLSLVDLEYLHTQGLKVPPLDGVKIVRPQFPLKALNLYID
jgi:hypothetical protein